MWTSFLAASTAIVIAGTSSAYAQNRSGPGDAQRWRPNVEDMRAFADARLAALKAGLQLNADQEKHWPAFEAAARDFQRQRIEAMTNSFRTPNQRLNPLEQMQHRAEALSKRGTALKSMADATAPLYGSLDDSQKRRFAVLNPLGQDRHRMGVFNRGPRNWNRGGFRRTEMEGHGQVGELLQVPIRPEQIQ